MKEFENREFTIEYEVSDVRNGLRDSLYRVCYNDKIFSLARVNSLIDENEIRQMYRDYAKLKVN